MYGQVFVVGILNVGEIVSLDLSNGSLDPFFALQLVANAQHYFTPREV